jgi:hypothetical protein
MLVGCPDPKSIPKLCHNGVVPRDALVSRDSNVLRKSATVLSNVSQKYMRI